MILFLTSSPVGIYRSSEPLDYSGFNPANGMVDELFRHWRQGSRCLFISAFPDEASLNDRMRGDFEDILRDTGLSFSCVDLCDSRNGREMAKALHGYDFVILGGGHVPTENAFFKKIGLSEAFRGFDGIVMGISAGSMNCARTVYAQPELPGEAADPSYPRFIPGLGLTEYNILPHYNAVRDDIVDGLRLMEDITFPDSRGRTFYAITDGAYLLQRTEDGTPANGMSPGEACPGETSADRTYIGVAPAGAEIRGEAYRIRDGKIEKISADGDVFVLE